MSVSYYGAQCMHCRGTGMYWGDPCGMCDGSGMLPIAWSDRKRTPTNLLVIRGACIILLGMAILATGIIFSALAH